MCTFYERVMKLSKERGISGSRACVDIGLSKSTLSDLKAGRKKSVSTETVQKFADYFGVTVGYLLGKEEKPTVTDGQKESSPSEMQLTEGEKELLELFRLVPEAQQPMVLNMIRAALGQLQ